MKSKKLMILLIIATAIVPILPFFGALGFYVPFEVLVHQRIPRVILGLVVGGGLACCGLIFQNLFQSSLATPYTLGTSSGAAFGAGLSFLIFGSAVFEHFSLTTILAFMGAISALLIVNTLYRFKRNCTISDLLLAGVAVNFFFSSCLLLIQYLGTENTSYQIINWLMGRLSVSGFENLVWLLPIIVLCIVMYFFHKQLDQLTAGEEIAYSHGVNVKKLRTVLFWIVSLTVAIIVSLCGPIGFVGLMIPHICRKIFPLQHKILIPAVFALGGIFLACCDAFARSIMPPAEIPVGIVTAIIGAIFFLFLLVRNK